ncbi:MAG TPA: hypothetical protein PK893_07620, partial [Candidatus Competibacteraceae bacterium]|nr:hypothetical protein [Candidatus Competibacteraceae bacterium]
LTTWIPEHRPRLVQAGLTALRAYIAAGRPRQPYPPMGSFEDWDLMVRRALTWLGEADPLAGTAQLEAADPVRRKLRALLAAWHEVFRTTGATSKEAVTRASETQLDEKGDEVRPAQALWDALTEHFTDRLGKLKAQLVGEFIRKYERRVEAGMRFENFGSTDNRQIWRVVIVDEQRFQKFHASGKQGHEGHEGQGKTAGAGNDPHDPHDPKTSSSENYGGLRMAELLPARLAQAAGLDLDAMLSGRLREEDFSKLSDGAADLARCLDHDQQQHLAELLARIDAAAQTPAP